MSDKPSEGRRISRTTSSHIIRRAIEFDEDRVDSIREEDLYGIARELGISEAAVTQALREEVAVVPPRSKQWSRLRFVLRRWAIQAGLCGMAGSAAMMVMKDGIPLNGLFPFLVPLLFAAFNRKGKHHGRYQLQNAAYWLGVTGTFVLLLGRIPGGLFSQTTIPIAMTAIAGSVVIGLRRRGTGKRGTENAANRQEKQDTSEAQANSGMLRLRLHSTVPLGATAH